MPTIYVDGFQLRIIPGDHDPAHVHIQKGGGEAVFIFENGIVTLREQRSMKASEVRRAAQAVASVYARLQELWKQSHHG